MNNVNKTDIYYNVSYTILIKKKYHLNIIKKIENVRKKN